MIPIRIISHNGRLRDGGGPRLDIRHSSSTEAPGGGVAWSNVTGGGITDDLGSWDSVGGKAGVGSSSLAPQLLQK